LRSLESRVEGKVRPAVRRLVFLLWCGCLGFPPGVPDRAEAMNFGRLEVNPRVAFEGVYEDNVFRRSPQDPEGPIEEDVFGSIRPGVSLLYDFGPTDFSFGYQTELRFYREREENNSYARNHDLDLSATRSFRGGAAVTLSDFLLIGTDVAEISAAALGNVDRLGVLPSRRDFRLNSTSLDLAFPVSRRFGLNPAVEYRTNWYGADLRGGLVERASTTEHHPSARLSGIFDWHRRNSVSLNLGFFYSDYDRRGTAKIYSAGLGDVWRVTPSFTISLDGGAEFLNEIVTREEEEAAPAVERDSLQPYGSLNLGYSHQDLSLTLTGFYGFLDSSGEGYTVTSRSVRCGADYQATDALGLSAFAFFSKDDSAGVERVTDLRSFQAGGRIEWQLLSWVSLNVQYLYINQKDEAETDLTYEVNRAVLGWVLTLPDSI